MQRIAIYLLVLVAAVFGLLAAFVWGFIGARGARVYRLVTSAAIQSC
jgi:hypothetical protein